MFNSQELGMAPEKLANISASHHTHNLSWQHTVIAESDSSINMRSRVDVMWI